MDLGTKCICFTSTKVQILTRQKVVLVLAAFFFRGSVRARYVSRGVGLAF